MIFQKANYNKLRIPNDGELRTSRINYASGRIGNKRNLILEVSETIR